MSASAHAPCLRLAALATALLLTQDSGSQQNDAPRAARRRGREPRRARHRRRRIAPAIDAELSDEVPLPIATPDGPARRAMSRESRRRAIRFSWDSRAETTSPTKASGSTRDSRRAAARLDDSRPAREVFGFVMFSRRITQARLAELAGAGARLLGFHPNYTWKVAIAEKSLHAVADLPFVRWIGVAPPEMKLHPQLAARIAAAAADEPLDVWVSLFDSDLNPDSTSEPIGVGHVHDPDGRERIVPPAESHVRICQSRGWQQKRWRRAAFRSISTSRRATPSGRARRRRGSPTSWVSTSSTASSRFSPAFRRMGRRLR